jgi:O-succinylbenzoic acid--CoA ligase
VHRLVALAVPGGPRFLTELASAFDAGDAVLPVDPRLPAPATRRLLDALAPGVVVDEHGGRTALPGGRPVEDGDALVVPTSGTSGEPKGVVLTRDAVVASALATSARLGADPSRDRWLACLPLAHVGGLSVITRSLVTGTPVEVHPRFEVEAVARANRDGATLVSLVATALARLGERAAGFRKVLLGGGPPPPAPPPNAVATYGMTETGSGIVYDGYPLEGVELRISPGGEVEVRGPMLFRGYRDGTDPRRPDGWFATGDAGALDASGRLTLHGRCSDLVISGGENVWPAVVEQVVGRHPSVGDVAVAGRPDPDWGERVVAIVVTAAGADRPPALEELRDLVKAELGPWSAPRELLLVDALPRSAGGKLLRHRLPPLLAGPAG